MWFVRCGWVHPPARMSACSGSSDSLELCQKHHRGIFFQSTATTFPTSRPIETTTKKMCVLVVLPARDCSQPSSVLAHALLLYWQRGVRAVLKCSAFPNVSVHVTDMRLHDHRTESSRLSGSAALLCRSVQDHVVPKCAIRTCCMAHSFWLRLHAFSTREPWPGEKEANSVEEPQM